MCRGSLSHQTLLKLFNEPVHIHKAARRLHSPVCRHACVRARRRERLCAGRVLCIWIFSSVFPSVFVYVYLIDSVPSVEKEFYKVCKHNQQLLAVFARNSVVRQGGSKN